MDGSQADADDSSTSGDGTQEWVQDAFSTSDVENFFTDDEGIHLLPIPPSLVTLPVLPETWKDLHLSRASTILSIDSVVLPGDGTLGLSLAQLCDTISQHRSLQQAEIISSEGYMVRSGAVIHRFLILQLRRTRRRMIWLRLDRLRSTKVSPLGFLRAGASTPANDTAQLAARKEDLVALARLETQQVFSTIPTLGDLSHMFRVICDELQRYELWPANCWFFVSLIQQHLGTTADGTFVLGNLPHPSLARDIRRRIHERLLALYHIPTPPANLTDQLKRLLGKASKPFPAYIMLLTASMRQDKLQNDVSPEARHSLLDLCRAITSSQNDFPVSKEEKWELFSTLASRLRAAHRKGIDLNHKSARSFWSLCARTLRDLGRIDDATSILEESLSAIRDAAGSSTGRRHRSLVLSSLKELTELLGGDAGQTERLCDLQCEIVTIRRSLYDKNPQNFRSLLAGDLHRYADFLQNAGRSELALSAWKEFIEVQRRHQTDSELGNSLRAYAGLLLKIGKHEEAYKAAHEALQLQKNSAFNNTTSELDLADALRTFAKFLVKMNHLDEACDTWNEALTLYRSLAPPQMPPLSPSNVPEFTNYLREYGDLLHATERYEEACSVDRELVMHFRRLHQERPSLYSNNFAWSLSLHGESLEKSGKMEEACKALEESVALYRELFTNDRSMFAPILVPVLSDYACVLYSLASTGTTPSAPQGEPTSTLAASIAHEAVRMAHWVEWLDGTINERLISALYRLARCLAEKHEWSLAQEAANEARRLLPHSPEEAKTANLLREVKELESRCSEAIHSQIMNVKETL